MRTVGDYTLLETAGASELGQRHFALRTTGEKASCIVEILDPEIASDDERVAAMLVEITSTRRFRDSRIDPILDAGRIPVSLDSQSSIPIVWIARPIVEGWTLQQLLEFSDQASEPLLVQVSVWLIAQAAEIVERAHRQGILHGALAPEAVRVTLEGQVFLNDLGLGSILSHSEARLAFRPPELLTTDLLTARADVYGLGMLLTTCLLGEAPFNRNNPIATRRAILEHRFPRVQAARPGLSPRVDDVLNRLCALDPVYRPTSPGAVAVMLKDLLGPSAHLIPSVIARQLERLPVQDAIEAQALRRTRKRMAAPTTLGEDLSEEAVTRFQSRRSKPRLSGHGLLAGALPRQAGRSTVGPFDLDALISVDGPIETYRARNTETDDPIYLRVLDKTQSSSNNEFALNVYKTFFEQEAALAGSLSHPNVLHLKDSGEGKGVVWAAYAPPPEMHLMNFVRSENRHTSIGPILLDLARMLSHLHKRRVLACGLRVQSVSVSPRGLAIFRDLSQLAPIGGALHPSFGKNPFCLSPEFAAARRHYPTSDLFSLGVIAYELLTGTRPFRGLDHWSVLEALRNRTPRAPLDFNSSIPVSLSRLTMQLLAKSPTDRPSSADDVVRILTMSTEPGAPT